ALEERSAAVDALQKALILRRGLAETQPEIYARWIAETLNNLGTLLTDLQERSSAREAYEEALKINEQYGEYIEASRVASNWGRLERNDGQNPRAFALFESAVSNCERGLSQLRERDHWDIFKRDIEGAYLALIGKHAQHAQAARTLGRSDGECERVVGLLEAL